ncbi:MAG: hypothetical protein ACLQDY_11085 [Streptosporangiaceae bacterium]
MSACTDVRGSVASALAGFDFRAATGAVLRVVAEANRYAEAAAPWRLAAAERAGDRAAGQEFDAAAAVLLAACRVIGEQLRPFLPGLAEAVLAACDDSAGRLPPRQPLFPRIGRVIAAARMGIAVAEVIPAVVPSSIEA